jgi:hypothetical protein
MKLRQTKCDVHGCCHNRLVRPWAILLVMITCTVSLGPAILTSVGLTINSSIAANFKVTFLTIGLVFALFISIVLGSVREHENEWFCFLDSVGLPALVAALFFGIHQ